VGHKLKNFCDGYRFEELLLVISISLTIDWPTIIQMERNKKIFESWRLNNRLYKQLFNAEGSISVVLKNECTISTVLQMQFNSNVDLMLKLIKVKFPIA